MVSQPTGPTDPGDPGDSIDPADLADPIGRCDPLLRPYLRAADEATADHLLGSLLLEEAAPLLGRVLRGQLGGSDGAEADLEDLRSAALLQLTRHLKSLRSGVGTPVASFAGYVAVTGFNAWRAFLRRRAPERARLHDRLRYLFTRDCELALWQDRGGAWICGEQRLAPRGPLSRPAASRLEIEATIANLAGDWGGLGFGAQVRAVLRPLGRPCRFADLADLLALQLGIADPSPRSDELDGQRALELSEPGAGVEERLIGREYLARLWGEIRLLPRAQRVALLLNLRDDKGREMLGLLPMTGVAGQGEIAAVLEIAETQLAGIWPDLPRDDLWIASFLGLARRQVINLRKTARARLERRLRGH